LPGLLWIHGALEAIPLKIIKLLDISYVLLQAPPSPTLLHSPVLRFSCFPVKKDPKPRRALAFYILLFCGSPVLLLKRNPKPRRAVAFYILLF
jgi:hypothetical protein